MAAVIWDREAAMLRALLARLFGGSAAAPPEEDSVEYKGYRIRPTPFPRLGQYQTAGTIEKEIGGDVKEHRFVRAETHSSHEEAIAYSIVKAKQIIDEQGDRLFG
jgi:hypothetical protein